MRPLSWSFSCVSVVLVPVACVGLLLAQPARQPLKCALLVGVSTYSQAGFADHPLPFSAPDMELLADILRQNSWEVKLLTSKGARNNATRADILAGLDKLLGGVQASDLILVSLSGHGQQFRAAVEVEEGKTEQREEAFFCPSDAEKATPKTMLGMTELTRRLGRKGGQNLVLVDACRDDPRKGGIKGVDGNAVRELPENISILFSCRAGQQSFETNQMYGQGSPKGHGVFFYRVLKGLQGEASNRRGEVTWDSLQSYVRENVNRDAVLWFPERALEAASGKKVVQTPQLVGSQLDEPPILVRVDQVRDRTDTRVEPKRADNPNPIIHQVKSPQWKFAFDLAARQAEEKEFSKGTRKYGIEVFLDPNSNKVVYVSETGAIAVLPLPTAGLGSGKSKDPVWQHAMELRVRQGGEKDFTESTKKYSLEVFRDENTGNLIYVCETGSIAVVPSGSALLARAKNPEWKHAMELKARKAGQKEFDDAKKHAIEVFRDENTGNLVYITDAGNIAVLSGVSATDGRANPTWKHAMISRVRKGGDPDFTDKTPKIGVEIFQDSNTDKLIYLSEMGLLATPATLSPIAKEKAPQWKYGLQVKVRKAGDSDWNKANRYGMEIFIDENTGGLLYITETGAVAAVKE